MRQHGERTGRSGRGGDGDVGAGRGGDAEDDGAEREGYGAQARQGTQRHRDSLSGIRNWSGTARACPPASATTQAGMGAHGGARPGLPTSQTRAVPSDALASTAIVAGRIATASGRPRLSTTSTTQRRTHQTTRRQQRAQHVCGRHPRRQLLHPPRRRRGSVLRVARCVPDRGPGRRQRREQGVQPQLAQHQHRQHHRRPHGPPQHPSRRHGHQPGHPDQPRQRRQRTTRDRVGDHRQRPDLDRRARRTTGGRAASGGSGHAAIMGAATDVAIRHRPLAGRGCRPQHHPASGHVAKQAELCSEDRLPPCIGVSNGVVPV